MSPELWEQVQIVVDESLHLGATERTTFLEQACEGRPELRQEVDSLLASADDAHDFIEEPVFSLRSEKPPDASPDQRIGPYKLLSQVGSGGMGTVYLASRADDYEKPVALKVLKRGMDTDEIVRRFQHERQILANLDHPHISKLLDGGTTADGRPYFVMEQVQGEPIDRYCDIAKLSTRERLELFRKVCSAVHFAHQNLVVHRDLKPGNILVTEDGEPKLLDFGIAKLLEAEMLSTQTPTLPLLTLAGTGPMTPRYASPEQVRGDAITTSSDVYSLGVLLFKLLTGHRPYRLQDHSLSGLFKAIREQDPAKPSEAIFATQEINLPDGSSISITPEAVSGKRDGSPAVLRRCLAGDLDCIVLKALRKETKDRYGSVEQLSADIERHLDGLPVLARKGTLVYQVAKFFRRHRTRAALGAAVLLVLLFGSLWMSSQNQAARDRQIVESVSNLFTEVVQLDAKAGEASDFAARFENRVTQFVDSLTLAEILNDQGVVLEYQGGIQTAEVLIRQALAMKRRLVDDEHPSIARSLNNLASNFSAQGKYKEAERLYLYVLDLGKRIHGPESFEVAIWLNNLGTVYQNVGNLEASSELIEESLEIRKGLGGPDSLQVGYALNNRAFQRQLEGDFDAAVIDYRKAFDLLMKHLGADHVHVAKLMRNLATALQDKGELEEAEKLAQEALEILRKNLRNWQVADAESVLGGVYTSLGRFDEAERLLGQSYPVIESIKGVNARQTKEARARLEALEEARPAALSER